MRILLLTEDISIFDDDSESRRKVLEYASIASTLFVVVASDYNKDSLKTKQIAPNAWIYQTNSHFNFLKIYNIFSLISFELKVKGIFQADLVISDSTFTSLMASYLVAKKYKRLLYVLLSEANEKSFFRPVGVVNYILTKISWHILTKAYCLKVDSFNAREKLLGKSPALKIEVIKPFIDISALRTKPKIDVNEDRTARNLIKKRFPQFRFTAVAFVDSAEQIKLALEILDRVNKHFPPISLILLLSNNLLNTNINHYLRRDLKSFVYAEIIGNNISEYLSGSNVFWGISTGEKYEEILSKACILGATIITKDSEISRKLIEDNATGFISETLLGQEITNYFVSKTFFLMENPEIGLSFKLNVSMSFEQQFSNSKDEYISKLKSSLEENFENYKNDHLKWYSI